MGGRQPEAVVNWAPGSNEQCREATEVADLEQEDLRPACPKRAPTDGDQGVLTVSNGQWPDMQKAPDSGPDLAGKVLPDTDEKPSQ